MARRFVPPPAMAPREALIAMIAEYARHVGHAGLPGVPIHGRASQ